MDRLTCRRFWRTPTAAVALLALTLATVNPAPAAGQSGAPLGFTEGRWIGSFSYLGTQELGGVPVRYRATGTFELVSSSGGTTGLWDMYLSSLIEGGVANAVAGGASDGDGITVVDLFLDKVTATDALTGLQVTLTGEQIPNSGAGLLIAESTACNALTGSWEVPFTGSVLQGDFVANRAVGGDVGPAWQRLQQAGLDLLTRIDDGEVPIDAIGVYLRDAEVVMGDTTERDDTCAGTFGRFNTAALALGDAMISALASRIEDLSNDELLEVARMGWRSGAFVSQDLEFPYQAALDLRMTAALTAGNLRDMEYWLPVARELGRDVIAENLEKAIEDAR